MGIFIAGFLGVTVFSITSYADSAPQVCIEPFPEDSNLSKIKKDLYIKEIKAGITEWENMLKQQSPLPRAENWKWNIDIVNYQGSINCNIIVKFKDKPEGDDNKLTLGTFQKVGGVGVINMYYFTPYSCEVNRDSQYIYYGVCRSPIDLATTEEFGSIFRHEFGHALGLSHVDIKTSLMHPTFELISYKGKITTGDVKNVIDMYPDGLYFKDIIPESEIIEVTSPEKIKPIPDWIRNNAVWWADGQIDDTTFVSGIKFLITKKIIIIPPTASGESTTDEIPSWIKTNARWWADGVIEDKVFIEGIEFLIKKGIISIPIQQTDSASLDTSTASSDDSSETQETLCSGNAGCFTGVVTSVIDGDTIKVDGQSIRFALVDAPKIKYDGGKSRNFIEQICPVGSTVVVDQDDEQIEDKYGRMLGVIYCNDLNLNKELLDSGLGDLYSAFCDQSEFSTHSWALKHGCADSENETN